MTLRDLYAKNQSEFAKLLASKDFLKEGEKKMKPLSGGEVALLVVLFGILAYCLLKLFASSGSDPAVPIPTPPPVSGGGGMRLGFGGAVVLLAVLAVIVFAVAFGSASPEGQIALATSAQGAMTGIFNGIVIFALAGLAIIGLAIIIAVKGGK